MSFDDWMLALCVWREARSCSMGAMMGVVSVIRNRAADSKLRWPRTVAEVITQPMQFSSFNAHDPNATMLPSRVHATDFGAFQNAVLAVTSPMQADPTNGANHYHSIPEGQLLPFWADASKLTVTIGPFKFYKL